jgi:hypothetical protein
LKSHAYGNKRAQDGKLERSKSMMQDNNRYYPSDKAGNIDEWEALLRGQRETL